MGLRGYFLLVLALVCGLGAPLRALAGLPAAPKAAHEQGAAMPCHDALELAAAAAAQAEPAPCPHCLEGLACGQCSHCWLVVHHVLVSELASTSRAQGHEPWFATLSGAPAVLPQAVPTPPPRAFAV